MNNLNNRRGRSRVGRREFCVLLAALVAVAVSIFGGWPGPTAAQADPERAPVVVSLTYDDGIADQMQAASMMASHGMHGTFYVNSGRFGIQGRMSVADVQALQAAGNEVGGHTVSHADLPTLSTEEQTRQICTDRVSLLNLGLQVANFAYPYGDSNPAVEQVVADCGYNSARGVGDIVSPGSCSGCAYAEQIPPVQPLEIKTPDSVKPDTSLEDLQNYVLQAEQNGGGWVVLVMHHICDHCDAYSVPSGELEDFLGWLEPRAAEGTVVKTVAEVIGGTVKPGVGGPPAAPPLDRTNLLRNSAMEDDSNHDGVPDCWQRGGYGVNTFVWSTVSDAHSGSVAERVELTSVSSGDRKMISPQDLGACSPPAVVGHNYRVSGWYKSTVSVRLVVYYRDAANRWLYLAQSPQLPASPESFRNAIWTTPVMPEGSRGLSVGFALGTVGSLIADDITLNDSDQEPPVVSLVSPGDGTRLRGAVTFTAQATDPSGIDHVDFLVDGVVACTVRTAPYRCDDDLTTMADSVIAVTARAVDTAHNVGLSPGRNYTVSNSVPPDETPPTVALTSPVDGSTVDHTITLTADASDDDAVGQVLFYVNGVQVGAASVAPYQVDWNTATVPDGPVTLEARALDLTGNLGTSAPITVTVNDYPLDTVAPVSAISCNGAACNAGWYRTAVPVALTATDDATGVQRIVYTTDGTEPTATNGIVYTGPFLVSALSTVQYRAWDNAGNTEPVNSVLLHIDTVAPTAVVGAPAGGSTVTGTVYIRADVSDNIGIARVWFYLDDKALGSRIVTPYQWKWDTGLVAKGSHTLYVVALDAAGNQTRSATVTVTVA